MNNFDNFDDLIKKKVDGMDFPFSEENWQKASGMIDATRRGAGKSLIKTLFIPILAASAVLVAFIAGYYILSDNDSGSEKKTENNIAANMQQTAIETNECEKTSHIQIASVELKKESVAKPETNDNPKDASALSQAESSKSKSNNSGNRLSTLVKSSTALIATQSKKSDSPSNTNTSVLHETKIVAQDPFGAALPPGEIENAKLKITDETESPSVNQDARVNQDETVISSISESAPKNENVVSELKVQPLEQTKVEAINQPDTTTAHQTAKRDYVRTKHHELQAELGALNSFGWKINNTRNGNSLSPVAGINYIYHFDKTSALLIGAQYNAISNLTESSISFSVTSYNFGMKSDVTTFKFTELQYVVIPLKYLHRIHKNGNLGIGLNTTYLFNIKNNIETYKVIDTDVSTKNIKAESGYGYELCNTINAQLALSYSYAFNNKLAINAELNRSMMNVFKNNESFHANGLKSKAMALKLSLTYTLFKK
jgi:hypothetical protein